MAGGKSVSENYAFAGMHHIFDQHSDAGTFLVLSQILYIIIYITITFLDMGNGFN